MRFGPFIKIFISALLFLAAAYLGVTYRSDVTELFTGRNERLRQEELPVRAKPFFDALVQNDVTVIGKELDQDPSLAKMHLPIGGTGLHLAVSHGQTDVAVMLLDHGADLEGLGEWGGTPLHWACLSGNTECVDLLIKRGAKIEARDVAYDSTPMLWAAHGLGNDPAHEKAYQQICQTLYDAGASCDTTNREGVPAIQFASPAVAKFLKDHGARDVPGNPMAPIAPTSVKDAAKNPS